jgi:hypothetical protein
LLVLLALLTSLASVGESRCMRLAVSTTKMTLGATVLRNRSGSSCAAAGDAPVIRATAR